MKNYQCLYCGFVNSQLSDICQRCKNFRQVRRFGKQNSEVQLYIPTFQTDLFGIMLMNQKQYDGEVFSATRWIFLFVPLFPLTNITFKINKIETIASQMTLFRLRILKSRFPDVLEVLSVYLQIILGLSPIILSLKFGDFIKNTFGFWGGFITIVGSVVLFILMLIKLQNDKIDYKKYES